MSKQSESVKLWRQNTKDRMVEAFGGKCCICEYDKCNDALEFHHLDPSEKEFSYSAARGNIKGWKTLVKEMKKCVMLCSNCHKEIHSPRGNIKIPINAQRFNEDFNDYKNLENDRLMNACPICDKQKPTHLRTCSSKCAAKLTGTVDWENIDVISLVNEHENYEKIGRMLDISGAAVRKRYLKVL